MSAAKPGLRAAFGVGASRCVTHVADYRFEVLEQSIPAVAGATTRR